MSDDGEEWRDVEGYDGRYQVSNIGRVRSLPREGTRGGILKPAVRKGYTRVKLSSGRTTYKWRHVHALVLEAFEGPCPPGQQICHFDDNPENNRLENLRYGYPADNLQDKVRRGIHGPGGRLPRLVVVQAMELRSRGLTWREVASVLKVPEPTIRLRTKAYTESQQ